MKKRHTKRAKHTEKEFREGVVFYRSPSNMEKNNYGLYHYGATHGLLDKVEWPERKHKHHTDEEFYEGVILYKSPSNMVKNDSGLYQYGATRGLLDKVEWPERKSRSGLSEERLKKNIFEVSRDSDCRSDFKYRHPGEYQIALKYGWLDEMYWLKPKTNKFVDKVYYIYVYFFPEHNACYVGLSHHGNKYDRNEDHHKNKRSQVFKFAKNNDIEIPDPVVVEDELTMDTVREREDFWKSYYADSGWIILNVGKTGKCSGSLGGFFVKWTYKKCYKVAKKCSSRSEMGTKYPSAYVVALKNGWMDDYTWFVPSRTAPKAVVQCDLDGNAIRRYVSVTGAADALGIDVSRISACCRGKRKTTAGYVWKFENDVPAKAAG